MRMFGVPAFAVLACAACGPAEEPPGREPAALAVVEPADPRGGLDPGLDLGMAAEPNARVAGLDLDGDGRDEIVVAGAGGVVALRREGGAFRPVWRAPARGGATAIAIGDLDGDGAADLAVGWGVHRDHLDARAVLSVYRSRGAAPGARVEVVAARPETPRAQFSSLQVAELELGAGPGLLYAHFVSKYDVRAAFGQLEDGRFRERELGQARMAALWVAAPALGGPARLFVGRPYGDAIKSDGDVFGLGADGTRLPLPSLRGVRSLAVVELGPADRPLRRVCYGDGWHWRYRDEGRGLLTCARPLPDGTFVAQRVDETEGYEIHTIASGDLDGDGVTELVAQGPDASYAYTPGAIDASPDPVWQRRTVAPGGLHLAVVDTDGDGRLEIVLGGERPSLWTAH